MEGRPSFIKSDLPVQDSVLAQLAGLADMQLALEQDIKLLEKDLEMKKQQLNKVSIEAIPTLLKSTGLSQVKLADGRLITVKDDINVTIADQQKFLDWLQETQQDDIVKTMFKVDRVESTVLRNIFDFFISNEIPYEADRGVHPQTLKKFFKSITGVDLPEEEREKAYQLGKLTPPSSLPEFCKVYQFSKSKIK